MTETQLLVIVLLVVFTLTVRTAWANLGTIIPWVQSWWRREIEAAQAKRDAAQAPAQPAHYVTESGVPAVVVESINAAASGAATMPEPAQSSIATTIAPINEEFVFDPVVVELADLINADPAALTIELWLLARLSEATEKGRPVFGETNLIKFGLGIAAGSRSPKYKAAKAALEFYRSVPPQGAPPRSRLVPAISKKRPPMPRPEYRSPLTPEQQLLREELGLEPKLC